MTPEEKLIWAAAFVAEARASAHKHELAVILVATSSANETVELYRHALRRARRLAPSDAYARAVAKRLDTILAFAEPEHRKPCMHCGSLAVKEGETTCLGCGAERGA